MLSTGKPVCHLITVIARTDLFDCHGQLPREVSGMTAVDDGWDPHLQWHQMHDMNCSPCGCCTLAQHQPWLSVKAHQKCCQHSSCGLWYLFLRWQSQRVIPVSHLVSTLCRRRKPWNYFDFIYIHVTTGQHSEDTHKEVQKRKMILLDRSNMRVWCPALFVAPTLSSRSTRLPQQPPSASLRRSQAACRRPLYCWCGTAWPLGCRACPQLCTWDLIGVADVADVHMWGVVLGLAADMRAGSV